MTDPTTPSTKSNQFSAEGAVATLSGQNGLAALAKHCSFSTTIETGVLKNSADLKSEFSVQCTPDQISKALAAEPDASLDPSMQGCGVEVKVTTEGAKQPRSKITLSCQKP